MNHARLSRTLLATSLLLGATFARADIQVGNGTNASVTAGTPLSELVLIVWDRTAKVSYTKDLGIAAYASNYAAGDTTKNLFVYGQQDSGFQKLFPALNSDPNFQTFLSSSSGLANQVWAVIGAEINEDAGGIGADSFTLFTTLNSDKPAGATTIPAYYDFAGKDVNGNPNPAAHFNNTDLSEGAANFNNWALLNNYNAASVGNTHQCALYPERCSAANASVVNGSSFDTETSRGYAEVFLPNGALRGAGYGNILNKVGNSSWFYRGVVSDEVGENSIVVDEFDNLSHDAYWGLGVDASGNYILSYTLEAHLAQAQTAAGSLLRLRTDFAAHYGSTRLISVPGDSLDLGGAVTAVPEPATWGLMGLGLALLAGRARRQQRG